MLLSSIPEASYTWRGRRRRRRHPSAASARDPDTVWRRERSCMVLH